MIKFFLKRSEFSQNTIILIIGTVISQAVPLILHPILRRIYSPEDFGAMAIYLNIFSFITIIACLRYDSAIVLPDNQVESANILGLTMILSFFFCIALFFAMFFFKNDFAVLINYPEKYSNYLYILPFTAFLYSCYQSINFWLIRQKAFKAITKNKISRRGFEGIVQTSSGFLRFHGGLFIGDLVGNLANFVSGIIQSAKNGLSFKYISVNKMIYVAKKYSDFPKYNALPSLLSSLGSMLPFIFINKFYSTEVVGYLDLSRMVLSIPLVFIALTISQVFYQKISEQKNKNESFLNEIKNILYILLFISALEYIVILLFGKTLFGFVFGAKYSVSGDYSKILIYSFILNFFVSTFSSVFLTLRKIWLNSIWQILYFLCICILAFCKGITIETYLKYYVMIEVTMYLLFCIMLIFIIYQYEKKIKIKN